MKTFEQFFRDELAQGAVDFALRAHVADGYRVTFYIHALGQDSETADYMVHNDVVYPCERSPLTINNTLTDRENLEWLVYFSLHPGDDYEPIISMGRGAELLGFNVMGMREWLRSFKPRFDAMNMRDGKGE